jgi:hypothetical protein
VRLWVRRTLPPSALCRWGSSFSNKFFLEKRFVVKHIYNKHGHKLDEQREVIRDELYWLAYEAANKAKHAAARAEAKHREAAARTGAASGADGDAHMAEAAGHGGEWQVRKGDSIQRIWLVDLGAAAVDVPSYKCQ